ncbi:MAG: GDP-mannose 4,6-dehydratase [Nitrospirae bacterium]|nr:GDP-mannose 4,6-dehydratase [Nitrospirota bacterium]
MKVLITGGAGFIGSHLAEKLLNDGEEVYIIDDLSTGRVENIEHLQQNPQFHYFFDTIMNRFLLAELIDRADIVFHLAAAVGVRLIVESPVRTIETNVKGTEHVLELASKKNKIVVIASSSEVYGKSRQIPFREVDDLVLGPTNIGRWSYACSKALDEFLALAYWKEKGCPTIVVRFFNTVGPRQTGQYGMVLPRFVSQALAGEPITVYGTGEQSRCLTWVGDVVQAVMQLATHPQAVGEIFNIGGTEEITIRDLAFLVKDITDSQSEVKFIPYEQAYEEGFEDMQRRVPSIDKIQKLIGFKPTLDIVGIVSKVKDYFQKNGVESC